MYDIVKSVRLKIVLSLKDMFHAIISFYFEMIFTQLNLRLYGSYRR